jgi:hypothetical protein
MVVSEIKEYTDRDQSISIGETDNRNDGFENALVSTCDALVLVLDWPCCAKGKTSRKRGIAREISP